jgi:hypothetical protein
MEIVPFVRFLLPECTMSASKEAAKGFLAARTVDGVFQEDSEAWTYNIRALAMMPWFQKFSTFSWKFCVPACLFKVHVD